MWKKVVVINVYPFSGVVHVRWSVPGLAPIWMVKVTKNGRLEEDGTALEPLLRYAKSRFVYQSPPPSPQNRSFPLRTVFGVWGYYQNEIKNNNNSHNTLSRFRTRARLNEQLTMNRKTIWWRCPNTPDGWCAIEFWIIYNHPHLRSVCLEDGVQLNKACEIKTQKYIKESKARRWAIVWRPVPGAKKTFRKFAIRLFVTRLGHLSMILPLMQALMPHTTAIHWFLSCVCNGVLLIDSSSQFIGHFRQRQERRKWDHSYTATLQNVGFCFRPKRIGKSKECTDY